MISAKLSGCLAAVAVAGLLGVSTMRALPAGDSGTGPDPKAALTYSDILGHLTDLDRLTYLQTGLKGGLFSSWDRNGRTTWGANGDAAQYLRVEPNGEAVMMDLDGPGVVYRIWSANPVGKIRLYLDGSRTPNYEWNFPDLFDGKLPPFVKPLVYRRDSAQSASDAYLPIPFAKHIKITADKAHGQYYHFNYVLFPRDRDLASFRLPLSPEEQRKLNEVVDVWSNPGRDPKPRLPGQQRVVRKVTLAPGATEEVLSLSEPGVIRAVRARVQSGQRYAWRKLVLQGTWDGASWPQVLTPLGPFFGFDWETADYGSVTTGCRDGQAYQYWAMPFRKSAALRLRSFLEQPATVDLEIEWAPRPWRDDSVYFFARWRSEPDTAVFDYPFLETAGRGHFVGVSMPIDHPLPGWWGEGDEKVWVDDDDYPPYIGTGSEDYFGDAWGIRYLSGPAFGASSFKGHRTCNYRWHFTDIIPFTRRMRMTIENYGPNGQGPRGQYEYTSTAFWYQAEVAPPFPQLRGIKYTGGTDPGSKPAEMQYNPETFPDLTADRVRTYGLGIVFARQAEHVFGDAVRAGKAKVLTDALLPYEFDRERAVDFGPVKAGTKLGEAKVSVDGDGVYQARIYTAKEPNLARISIRTSSMTLPVLGQPEPNTLLLGSLFLPKGEHALAFVAATDGRAMIDSFQLESVPRFAGAIEAEELGIVGVSGAAAPQPSDPMDGVSAGRVLRFGSTRVGQRFTLNLGNRPNQPYVLGVRPMLGPGAGVLRAFVADQPIGPEFDLYAAQPGLGPSILPLGPVPEAARTVEIRLVGVNPASRGGEIALDYFRWEPAILGPGTAEGVWAEVIKTQGCEYRPQDLGGDYSGGHHFWVQPCGLNGWVDIAFHVPKTGLYEIIAKYTKSWDYATVQAFLEGRPLGSPVDTYAPSVVPGEPTALGREELKAGRHVLRFQAVGHHAESKGYLMGIDHVILKPLP